MTIWWLAVIIAAIIFGGMAFIWLAIRVGGSGGRRDLSRLDDAPEKDVEHIFNEEFREELRNRGRLHFEKIISDSATFLQQDLRLTTAQLNEYMKSEMAAKLKEEFAKY